MSSTAPGSIAVSAAVPSPRTRTASTRRSSSASATENGRRRKYPGIETSANMPGRVTAEASRRR